MRLFRASNLPWSQATPTHRHERREGRIQSVSEAAQAIRATVLLILRRSRDGISAQDIQRDPLLMQDDGYPAARGLINRVLRDAMAEGIVMATDRGHGGPRGGPLYQMKNPQRAPNPSPLARGKGDLEKAMGVVKIGHLDPASSA